MEAGSTRTHDRAEDQTADVGATRDRPSAESTSFSALGLSRVVARSIVGSLQVPDRIPPLPSEKATPLFRDQATQTEPSTREGATQTQEIYAYEKGTQTGNAPPPLRYTKILPRISWCERRQ